MNKAEIRNLNKIRRKNLSAEAVLKMSDKASKNLINSEIYKNSEVIMLYYPLGNETDTARILEQIIADKKTAVYPVTVEDKITPVVVNDKTKFKKGAYSVSEPEGEEIDKQKIDLVIVPGIAFDKMGNRIGFGKGCYDRFLQGIKAIKVGYCYSFQTENEIKADKYDIKMDYIVSEEGIDVV